MNVNTLFFFRNDKSMRKTAHPRMTKVRLSYTPTRIDSDSDTDTGIDANVNATLPTVSALIQCSLTPSIDLEEQEEEVDTGTCTPVTQTPTEPAELLLNPVQHTPVVKPDKLNVAKLQWKR